MAQHDLVIANQGFPAFRADLNGALGALGSTSKGASRPSGAVAGQLWLDDDTPGATLWTLFLFDGSDDVPVALVDAAANKLYPACARGELHGLAWANNSGDAANDIDVGPGIARDDADSDTLLLTATLTKRLDAAWAVGSNQGGLDTGSKAAGTLYALWLVKRPDTGVVDGLFSASFTAPTMPTDYTKKRLIGAVLTDAGSSIVGFVQQGDHVRYTGAAILDVDDSTITADAFEVGTLSVPPNALAQLYVRGLNTTETASSGRVHVRRNGAADAGTGLATAAAAIGWSTGAFRDVAGLTQVMTDASRQVQYAMSEGAGAARVILTTVGYTMLTRGAP